MDTNDRKPPIILTPPPSPAADETASACATKPKPHPEPTRYGDWEMNGKCVDF